MRFKTVHDVLDAYLVRLRWSTTNSVQVIINDFAEFFNDSNAYVQTDNSGFFNISSYICTNAGHIPKMEGPIYLGKFQQVNGIGLSSTFSNKN